jgi:hypothetical protein
MTLNNYTDEEVEHLRNVDTMNGKIKYITFIKEVGANGTPHLQIYVQSKNVLSVKAWHELLGQRVANIVPTVDPENAIKYCQGLEWCKDTQTYEHKEGSDLSSVFQAGTIPQPGRRNDIHAAADHIRADGLRNTMLNGSEHEHTIASHYQYFKDLDQIVQSHNAQQEAAKDHYLYMSERTN